MLNHGIRDMGGIFYFDLGPNIKIWESFFFVFKCWKFYGSILWLSIYKKGCPTPTRPQVSLILKVTRYSGVWRTMNDPWTHVIKHYKSNVSFGVIQFVALRIYIVWKFSIISLVYELRSKFLILHVSLGFTYHKSIRHISSNDSISSDLGFISN